MRRFTTPTVTANIAGIDLTGYKTYLTLKQGPVLITLENLPVTPTEDGCTLTGVLTQEQTAMFNASDRVQMQVRFINAAGVASATNIKAVTVNGVLLNEVINYG